MAGKGRSRGRGRFKQARIEASAAVGALATRAVTTDALCAASDAPYRFMSLDGTWSLSDSASIGDAQGPLAFGVAHSDYSAAEIEECLEAAGSMEIGDKIANEQANRLVRQIGVITADGENGQPSNFNDGKPVKVKLNWGVAVGDFLDIWVYNLDIGNLTTGLILDFVGHGNLKFTV